MHFSHISIGGGITGLETIISAFTNIQRQLKKQAPKDNNLNLYNRVVAALLDSIEESSTIREKFCDKHLVNYVTSMIQTKRK